MPLRSRASRAFWSMYRDLPEDVRIQAKAAYRQWSENPRAPGLHFKQLQGVHGLYSARVNRNYRVIAANRSGVFVWVFIGTHAEFERYLASRSLPDA